jgi:hypothetical protein
MPAEKVIIKKKGKDSCFEQEIFKRSIKHFLVGLYSNINIINTISHIPIESSLVENKSNKPTTSL